MSNDIQIGSVSIPLNEFAISGTAWLGIKKAGKTYGAKGVAEQLMDAGVPIIVFDAIGVWRFLKTPGDGPKAKGFKVVVAGGESPDIPLSAHNAAEIVRAAMRANVSLVIDLYDPKLSKADWRKIVQTCFHTLLYENKAYGTRVAFLEEAAEYVPQKVYDGETYAAVEKAIRMGGNVQLGVHLINPRSQELNKSVLDLCDNLVLMRQRGNAAIDAVQKWMDKVSPDIADKITASLPNMSGGECWVWAENSDTPVSTKTHKLHSFHPDRTKDIGQIKTSRPVDAADFVAKLLTELPKVVEEAKANDPRELKAEVRRLKDELRKAEAHHEATKNTKPSKVGAASVPRPVLKSADVTRLESLVGRLEKMEQRTSPTALLLREVAKEISGTVRAAKVQPLPDIHSMRGIFKRTEQPSVSAREDQTHAGGASDSEEKKLRAGAERMLAALAQWSPGGMAEGQLRSHAGLKKSGTYSAYMTDLRNGEYITQNGDGLVYATDKGIAYCGSLPPAPSTTEEVLNIWRPKLRDGARRMLNLLVLARGEPISKEELFHQAGIVKSGTSSAYLTDLKTARLIVVQRETVRADKETLFL